MRRAREKTAAAAAARSSADDEDISSDEGGKPEGGHGRAATDKLALRRAKNREAARRVRERRMNTIKHLSDQVEQLQAENASLKGQLEVQGCPAAAAGLATAEAGPSQSCSAAEPAEQDVSANISVEDCQAELVDASVQTEDGTTVDDPADKPPETTPPASSSSAADNLLEGLSTTQLLQLMQQHQSKMLQQHSAASSSSASSKEVPQDIQQMQLLLQMQMQMLQLTHNMSKGSGTAGTDSPAQSSTVIKQEPVVQQSQQQQQQQPLLDAAAAAAAPVDEQTWQVAAAAAAARKASEQQQQQQQQQLAAQQLAMHQQQFLQQHLVQQQLAQQQLVQQQFAQQHAMQAQSQTWGYGAQQLQQFVLQTGQQQHKNHNSGLNQPQMLAAAGAAVPQYYQHACVSAPLPQMAGQQQQAQAKQETGQQQQQQGQQQLSQQQQQQQQQHQLPRQQGGDAASDQFKPLPGALCPIDDEAILMSTDVNLVNTADMNITTSEFNAMLASEEILRHVPTPEEATASRSTAWL